MPIEQTTDEILATADRAVAHARLTRKLHARKRAKGTPQREVDLQVALGRLKAAMRPLRRRVARIPYLPNETSVEELRDASRAIQSERRKLWKMQQPKTTKKRA